MSDFKRITILVDAATGKQIDEFGSVVRDNDYFRLLLDETAILCCQFYDVNWIDGVAELNPHRINPTLTFAAFGDCDFDPTIPYMFLSEQSQDESNTVNLTGDWFNDGTANPLDGQLSFRVDTNTERFAEVLQNSSTTQSFYFCVTAIPSGQTATTVLAYFKFKAENRPSASTGSPASADPEYFNAQEVQALVKSAPIREFSMDGATLWHSVQVDADRYYREQRNGGEWSAAIALAVGPQGPQGADSFSYVAYASDNTGTDFNLTPSDTLKYRAEIHSTVELTPIESDFAGATWVQYIGDDGKDAPVVQYLFSVDGSSNWHPLPTSGDFFQKISVDGGVSWSPAIKFIGDDGTGIAPQGTYDSGITYTLNEGVTYNGSYYRSLTADNIGNQPDTSPAYWEEMISKGDTGPEVKHIIKDSATVTNGTVVLDAYKDIYTASISADTTFTFDISELGDLTNKVVTFELHIDMSTVSVLTFPASVSWIDTPVFSNTGKYILVFRSTDGGTNWLGNLAYEV